jgi:type VI secretion system secreted protein Hcp
LTAGQGAGSTTGRRLSASGYFPKAEHLEQKRRFIMKTLFHARTLVMIGTATVAILLGLSNSFAGFDAFLKIAGVPGESTDSKHEGWIEVLSFSWGVSQPSSAGVPTSEKSDHQDLGITKALDKASPKLAFFCCGRTPITSATLELIWVGGANTIYLRYTLRDCIISSVKPSGAKGNVALDLSEVLPMEEVSFNYGKIEWDYIVTNTASGDVILSVHESWNVGANTPITGAAHTGSTARLYR